MLNLSISLKFILNIFDLLEKNKGFLEKNLDLKNQIKNLFEKFQNFKDKEFQPKDVIYLFTT